MTTAEIIVYMAGRDLAASHDRGFEMAFTIEGGARDWMNTGQRIAVDHLGEPRANYWLGRGYGDWMIEQAPR